MLLNLFTILNFSITFLISIIA